MSTSKYGLEGGTEQEEQQLKFHNIHHTNLGLVDAAGTIADGY